MRKPQVFFLLILLGSQSNAATFVLTSSTIRRDAVAVKPTASQTHCNTTPGCEACMYYADRGNCVMMGPARSPPPETCPVPYSVYEKLFSGCAACSPPAVDRGYTPGPCSTIANLSGPPIPGRAQLCGDPGRGPERRFLLDAKLHDGTRVILENELFNQVFWNQYLCSWFYIVFGMRTYFKSATCVVPPTTRAPRSKLRLPLQTEQKIVAGFIADPTPPTPNAARVCPVNVQ